MSRPAAEDGPREAAGLGAPRPLGVSEAAIAAAAIARAFAWHEPWGAWVLPDPAGREATLRRLVERDLRERFLPHGRCTTIGSISVALWVPPAGEPGAEVFASRRGEAEYAEYGGEADRVRRGDELLRSLLAANTDGEHWYLDTIATDPSHRGRGLGGRLLDHELAAHDARGRRCALDTHTRENVAFYERRGFEVVATGGLPDGGPELFVLVRDPQSPG